MNHYANLTSVCGQFGLRYSIPNVRLNQLFYISNRLANEKYKTKSVTRNSNTSVTWLEQFDFHLYEDQSHFLEINLHEKEWKGSLGRDESIARYVNCMIECFAI